MDLLNQISEAAAFIRSKSQTSPKIGLILGSGLGSLADKIESPDKIPYDQIPHFPVSTVEGHAGQLVIGQLEGKPVIAMQGRFHYYEGYTMEQVTFPVRVMKALGVESLVVTNACGGLREFLYPGALMFITDHINFTGTNPLMGHNYEDLGPRFPDMSNAYDKSYISLGKKVANDLGIETREGVYTACSGPYYLSKAELAMVRTLGSDTIGMSTVPEVIVAVHSGIRCLGISCITDMAIPESLEPLHHDHVVKIAAEARPKFIRLVSGIVKEMSV